MNDEVLALACALIEKPSITPDDAGCQPLLIERLQKIGFNVTDYAQGDTKNFFATYQNHPAKLCFAGHTDVVPPGPKDEWASPPFSPTIREGILYGRGAADMKSAIAAMVCACERIAHKRPQQLQGMSFLITSDEEGSGINGTQAVLKQLAAEKRLPQCCLVGEASSHNHLADTLKIGRRGSLSVTMTFTGKQGHVAYPHLAQNALHDALPFLTALSHQEWDKGNNHFDPTSMQITYLETSTHTANVIPGTVVAKVNWRYSSELSQSLIQERVNALAATFSLDVAFDWHASAEPFITDNKHPFVALLAHTIEQQGKPLPNLSTSGGTSDGRFFAQYGIPVVELGAINASIHQVNECIRIEELISLSILYEVLTVAVLGADFCATS